MSPQTTDDPRTINWEPLAKTLHLYETLISYCQPVTADIGYRCDKAEQTTFSQRFSKIILWYLYNTIG